MNKLSVVVITFNEAENIGRCLDSVQQVADDILVVDSFSTDATVEIAREKRARIIQNPWEDYHTQRGFAVRHAQAINAIGAAAADCFSRAVIRGVLSACSMTGFSAFRDLEAL